MSHFCLLELVEYWWVFELLSRKKLPTLAKSNTMSLSENKPKQ